MKKVLGAMSGIIFAVFSIAILGMLMSFTWGALGKLFPNSFVNQMWGMIMFDIAAMCWALAFVFKSSSVGQYAASGIGFIVAFAGTLLMVTAEVIMGGQTFVQNNNMGQYMVYGFVIVTAIHAALIYLHHASAPEIHEKINIGIARGEITTEAIRQATSELDAQKADLARSISQTISDGVKRDLNIPIAVQPGVGFVPATRQYADAPYPTVPEDVKAMYAPGTRFIDRTTNPQPTQQQKNKSWYEKFKDTLTPKQKEAAMKLNEQTVVDVPKLQENPPAGLEQLYCHKCNEMTFVIPESKPKRCGLCQMPYEENPPAGDAPFPGE